MSDAWSMPELNAEIVQPLLDELGDAGAADAEYVCDFALGQSFEEVQDQCRSLPLGQAAQSRLDRVVHDGPFRPLAWRKIHRRRGQDPDLLMPRSLPSAEPDG